MPRVKTVQPPQSREKGQRSLDLPEYLTRYLPQWTNPNWLMGDTWRQVVHQQPIAMICRETLIANAVALDWKIEPRDSSKRDELRPEIDYYTRFIENDGDYDYTTRTEWVSQDYLDLPFGSGTEVGREGDDPQGKVLWLEPLDGATLFPTLNSDYPVGQTLKESLGKVVYFPKHAINRIYMTPRTNILRKGWAMPPPEKIYLALQLLDRGDIYYANLLLDTPEAGILDLIDMSKDSAENWLNSWKNLLGGIDPFKIPVLYEHDKAAVYIPFGRSPQELMFDKATMKYTSIVTAGYGMSISDIGLPTLGSGGETLAGTIRQERRTRKTGFGLLKLKLKYFWDRILPTYLEFKWIDLDDELSVALGRARLASATAYQLLIDRNVIIPNEARAQMIADGLLSISIKETIEGGDKPPMQNQPFGNTNERPGLLGRPISPSQGGQGEVKLSEIDDPFARDVYNFFFGIDAIHIKRMVFASFSAVYTEIKEMYSELYENDAIQYWLDEYNKLAKYNEGGNEVMRAMLDLSLSNISRAYTLSFSWSKETRKYLHDLFFDIYNEYHKKKSIYDYEHSLSDHIETEFVPPKFMEDETLTAIDALLVSYSDVVPDLFRKSVFLGMQKFLTSEENATKLVDELDTNTFIGDNVVSSIREELSKSYIEICSSFNSDFSKLIQTNLEDKENGN